MNRNIDSRQCNWSQWYRSEIRIIKNNKVIRSWNDAQGFRWKDAMVEITIAL